MALDPSISLQTYQPPPLTQTIGSLLNIQRTQAAIQGQNIQNQSGQIHLNNLINLNDASKGADVLNPDGTFNQDAYQQKALKSGGVDGPAQATAAADADTSNTRSQLAHLEMNAKEAQIGLDSANGALGDPRVMGTTDANGVFVPPDPTQATQALSEREDEMIKKGVNPIKAKMLISPYIATATHNPSALPQLMANSVKAGIAAQGQASQDLVPANQQRTVVPDMAGNPAVGGKDQFGNVQPLTPLPQSVGQPTPAPPLSQLPPGESDRTRAQLEDVRTDAQNFRTNIAPQVHANNQSILQNLQQVKTGNASGWLNKVTSNYANLLPDWWPGASDAQKVAASYDLIGKDSERNANLLSSSMGVSHQTDAYLASLHKATGSIYTSAPALESITKYTDALATGKEYFGQGLEAAIQSNPQKGIYNARTFGNDWANNFDVNAARALNAAKTGDQPELDSIIKSVGGPGSPGATALQQKVGNLKRLTNQGHL